MAPKARTAGWEKRRRSILEAALDCFIRKGYGATTMEDIRDGAGASIGSIYHHFASKEDLAGALYVEGLRDYQQGFLRALKRQREARPGIQAVVRFQLRWIQKHPNWARYLFHMREAEFVLASGDLIRRMNHDFFGELGDWLSPHVQDGTVASLPPDLYSSILIGPIEEFARRSLTGRTASNNDRAQRVLAETVWKALQGNKEEN